MTRRKAAGSGANRQTMLWADSGECGSPLCAITGMIADFLGPSDVIGVLKANAYCEIAKWKSEKSMQRLKEAEGFV